MYFFVPGTNTVATTSAFGVVLVDVETALTSKIEFFDPSNSLIFSQNASVSANQGLSFLGGVANAGERISRVRITSGVNTLVSNGTLGNQNDDFVVMDDFLYAEPVKISEPPIFTLLAVGLLVGLNWRQSRKIAPGSPPRSQHSPDRPSEFERNI